jgi:hypothetical protein
LFDDEDEKYKEEENNNNYPTHVYNTGGNYIDWDVLPNDIYDYNEPINLNDTTTNNTMVQPTKTRAPKQRRKKVENALRKLESMRIIRWKWK